MLTNFSGRGGGCVVGDDGAAGGGRGEMTGRGGGEGLRGWEK